MTLITSCAIRACLKSVRVETTEYNRSTDFVLCGDCETSIILDTHLRLEQDSTLEAGWMREFAALYNGWFRRRRGVSLAHRSGVVKSLIDLKRARDPFNGMGN